MTTKPSSIRNRFVVIGLPLAAGLLAIAARGDDGESNVAVARADAGPLQVASDTATYTLTFSADGPSLAVRARLPARNGVLTIATGGGIDHLPRQWATFVQNLRVTDSVGRPLAVRENGAAGWIVAGEPTGVVSLSYEVDLSYARSPWPPGNEQAGLWRDSALYSVTKPLFVTSEVLGRSIIRIEVPSDWNISVPWMPEGGRPGTYRGTSRDDLMDNSLVVGKHSAYELTRGRFTLILALPGAAADVRNEVGSVLAGVVDHLGDLFPRSPASRYLLTLFYAPQDDGEAFSQSAAFTTATVPQPANRMLWANNLAHELHHIWIGEQLRGDGATTFEWFDEGFSDYYADLALVRRGLITTDAWLSKLEKVLARYRYFTVSPAFPRISLVAAGERKGTYRFAVYDGGWSTAFCLDGLIRSHSGDRRGLDDMLRLLYDRFAVPGRTFTMDELAMAASDAAGASLRPFIDRYVTGTQPLPLEECLGRLGLEGHLQSYAAELWVTTRSDASPVERARFQRLTSAP